MNVLKSAWRRPTRFAWVALPALLLVAFAACTGDSATYPQSTLIPKGDFAEMVDKLFMTTVWWALAVFILVLASALAPTSAALASFRQTSFTLPAASSHFSLATE